jgi:hypothetical protein
MIICRSIEPSFEIFELPIILPAFKWPKSTLLTPITSILIANSYSIGSFIEAIVPALGFETESTMTTCSISI